MQFSGRFSGLVLGVAAALLTVSAAAGGYDVSRPSGKTITLKEPPSASSRCLPQDAVVHAAVEGTDAHFVGVNVKAKKTYENGIYAELLPDLLKLNFDVAGRLCAQCRGDPALKPDAVLQWTFIRSSSSPWSG